MRVETYSLGKKNRGFLRWILLFLFFFIGGTVLGSWIFYTRSVQHIRAMKAEMSEKIRRELEAHGIKEGVSGSGQPSGQAQPPPAKVTIPPSVPFPSEWEITNGVELSHDGQRGVLISSTVPLPLAETVSRLRERFESRGWKVSREFSTSGMGVVIEFQKGKGEELVRVQVNGVQKDRCDLFVTWLSSQG